VSLHEIALKNNLDELATLSEWVEQLSNQLGLSSRCSFRLDLVLTEAVTNIIENAYVDGQDHDISVTLQYEGNRAKIQLKDDGVYFNPLQQPGLILPKSLEDAAEGGLGLHLIRHYSDDCEYHRLEHENVLTLIIEDVK
jgi:anti-sigma regulatory factor (Ser/Thr protein kinase)